MKKKIKLRDMTYEQYSEWYHTKCSGVECKNCPFKFVFCNEDKDYCWVNHKEMFSDKFLNQEIEIDVEMKLTENDRKVLEFLKDLLECDRVVKLREIETLSCRNGVVTVFDVDLTKLEAKNILSNLEDNRLYLIEKLLKESEENEK